ncbi:MAG: ATP-grasp domain-containing protein [Acidobacteriota bacterium]|nr:ATP-grasp domain-containing protein [Acidobacteriota bacterium]
MAATTGYQTRIFLEAAAALGYDAVLATDRCHVLEDPWGDRAIALRFEDPEASVAGVHGLERMDGIVALGDRPATIAALIAKRLGLPFHSVDAVSICRDKYYTRSRFKAAGLPVPEFSRIAVDQDPSAAASTVSYPCVLKPLGLSASRGVIRANDPGQFVAAFRRIHALLDSPDIQRLHDEQDRFIQIEAYIPGREFALEGIVSQGQLDVIALFDKPDPLNGPFFEETLYVTPSRTDPGTQKNICLTAEKAVAALGLTHGPIHAEMRVNDSGVWMLEVAARPIGGLCARVLPGLPELILQHAVSDPWSSQLLPHAAGVMMLPIPRGGVYQSVQGVDAAKQIAGIDDVVITVKEGQRLVPLPEGNSYLGFIFAMANGPEEVEAALRASHSRLSFEISTALHVML